ncbi:MAG TPA: dihydroneopterin aldolase, partial [Candidatus Thermoplasmatota archaeon]|nr:dihydroneopterin aldolase [Candidatus Thermoplasmatota archaeon]
ITLAGIRLWTHVGCTVEERKVGQHLELDLVVEGDFRAAGREDDIASSVDYAKAFEAVSGAVAGKEAKLLETVAERAAAALLGMPGVRAATVRVRKDAPPIPHGHARYAEVEIRRER